MDILGDLLLPGRGLLLGIFLSYRFGFGFFRRFAWLSGIVICEVFQKEEVVTGVAEGLGGGLDSYSHDVGTAFMQSDGQRGEVAVAGDQHEAVECVGGQQVHGVDYQGHVGGVLARNVVELLLGLDSEALELVLPFVEVALLPVAVGALDYDTPAGGDFRHYCVQLLELGVVCIYKQCDFVFVHGYSLTILFK